MNKYITHIENIRLKTQKTHLNTVDKVESLMKTVQTTMDKAIVKAREAISLDKAWKKERDKIKALIEKHEKALEVTRKDKEIHDENYWDDVNDPGIEAMSLATDTYEEARELMKAVDAVEKGAKTLGMDIPPIVKEARKLAEKADKKGGELESDIEDLAYG
jgi:conjugal transfer/entry exclusion protein